MRLKLLKLPICLQTKVTSRSAKSLAADACPTRGALQGRRSWKTAALTDGGSTWQAAIQPASCMRVVFEVLRLTVRASLLACSRAHTRENGRLPACPRLDASCRVPTPEVYFNPSPRFRKLKAATPKPQISPNKQNIGFLVPGNAGALSIWNSAPSSWPNPTKQAPHRNPRVQLGSPLSVSGVLTMGPYLGFEGFIR